MFKSILALTLLTVPADAACRHHAIWHYPWPQCSTEQRPAPKRTWFVEVVPTAPSVQPTKPDITVPDLRYDTEVPDQRTPAQIEEYIAHNMALSLHHDELVEQLNLLMIQEEDAKASSSKAAKK